MLLGFFIHSYLLTNLLIYFYYLEFRKDVLNKLQVLEQTGKQQLDLLSCVLEQLTQKKTDCPATGDSEYKFDSSQFPMRDFETLDMFLQLLITNKKAYDELVGFIYLVFS